MARILIVFAHPDGPRSKIHQTLLDEFRGEDTVEVRDLYELYPDFLIDTRLERQKLLEADLIVLQFPLYWYSIPSILKEWFDSVWRLGFAYGKDSYQLDGKSLLPVVTVRETLASYSADGRNRFTIDELLRPLEASAGLARMDYHTPFVLAGTRHIQENEVLLKRTAYGERLRSFLSTPSTEMQKGN